MKLVNIQQVLCNECTGKLANDHKHALGITPYQMPSAVCDNCGKKMEDEETKQAD